jgi:hypothetical protein
MEKPGNFFTVPTARNSALPASTSATVTSKISGFIWLARNRFQIRE